ncbi:transcriptional regulator TyrR [Spartinivicinus ruber]|uniref:transcriptional regulator TyrR n=1 Tax=Spartinivicinus ruber TaxID=2683272 RepID=UPI0013D192BC|nr:transcriptional regulator TyrR [Spartinivicinus ruber]
MRLEITCQDRLGIAEEVLRIISNQQINLRGVEIDLAGVIYLSLPTLPFEALQSLLPAIRHIVGVNDVRTVACMPVEREHHEFLALLATQLTPVLSTDIKGNISIANDALLKLLGVSVDEFIGSAFNHWFKGINLARWLQEDDHAPHSRMLRWHSQEAFADILPIEVPEEEGNTLVGGLVCFKFNQRVTKPSELNQAKTIDFSDIFTVSPSMKHVIRQARHLAKLEAPLLITGETGTGKELLAKACHFVSSRADKPFLVLNCAALPDSVAETELFGYVKGAYSNDPDSGKKGLFELANGGTVLLDEIGEMSATLQVKLLRLLQDGTFRRIGGEEVVKVNVRIMCTTQKNLPALCQQGVFREDLFYRLNVLSLALPPLRVRKVDIVPMAEHFLKRFTLSLGEKLVLSKACCNLIQQYPWPGNVRQLENAIYRAASMAEDQEISPEDLHLPSYASGYGYFDHAFEGTLEEATKRFESELLTRLYPAYPSSRLLAKKLGVSHTAIAKKLKEYGIGKHRSST